MTRPSSMRRPLTVLTLGATMCAMTQLSPAAATSSPRVPALPTGPGHTVVVDVHTGEILSISATKSLPDATVKQFMSTPGAKTYTVDAHTGRVLSITNNYLLR